MTPHIIHVTWEDSRQPIPSWNYLCEYAKFEPPVVCETVGWVVYEDDDIIRIAQNLGDSDSDSMQVSGVITIPKSAIRSSKNLTK